MKKLAYILVAALAFAACQKEESQKDILVDEGLNTFTFTASVDNNVVDAETKATLSRGGVFSWAESDALKFYDTDGNAYDAVITAVDGEGVATIEVTAAGNPTFYSAIYPAAVAVGKNKVNIEAALAKGPVVVAEVGSGSLTFHHIGSIINIKINDIPAETTKMEIAPAAPAEWNAGIFSFTAGVPDFSGNGGFCYPVVPVTSADSGVDISVPIFAANYAGGFTIKLLNDAGRILYKKTTTKDYDLSGTKLLNMKALTYEAPTKFYVKTTSASGYWDKECVRMIQTGANTYSVQMNCDGGSDIFIFDNYNTDNISEGYLNKGHVDGGNFYEISWNTSTNSGGPNYISSTRDTPFWNGEYPVEVNGMCLSGTFNSWGIDKPFTYNNNMSWVLEGLDIASAGSYAFKIRKTQDAWSYGAGVNSGLGSALYGSLKGDKDAGDASVTLSAGTYNVYLNATSDWYYNIMFEKQ